MNIEATSSKPREGGFLSQFSKDQAEFLSTYEIETQEDFDLLMSNPTYKKEFENVKVRLKENPKQAEIAEKQTEVIAQKSEEKLSAEIGIAQLDKIEKTPYTPENAAQLAKDYKALGMVCNKLGVKETTVEVSPVVEKSLQRVTQNPKASLKFDFASGELLYEGVGEMKQDYLNMIAFDSAFAHQIPDNLLAKIDRQDIVKLADILDKEANKDNLTPQSIRGFQALAQLAQFNITELIRVGIFDKDMRLDEDKAKAWVDSNAAELRETRAIDVANLSWERRENSAAIAA